MSAITFSNAWNALGQSWNILGIVPGWAQKLVFACPECAAPAVLTEVYTGGRGNVQCFECATGHIVEQNGSEVAAILALVKKVITAHAACPWPTGQNIYITPDLWLTPQDYGELCLCRAQHTPQPVGMLMSANGNGQWEWRALPDSDIRRAIEKLRRSK